jgi:glucoamylase
VEGHWQQNQWLGGEPYWRGVQLDEAAYPVLLAALLADREALGGIEPQDMIRRALGCIARLGPSTDQDRWEENNGLNAFTLATCIAALVAGGSLLEERARHWATALADFWNAHLEDWMVAYGSDMAKEFGVAGYYVRTSPASVISDGKGALDELVPIRNRNDGVRMRASEQISTDFLRLVRFGLRNAADPLVLDTIRLVDRLLKVETPSGAVWYRYNGDGYGEYDDGRPYDGAGRGRPWPLLAGERGHYALSAGEDPLPMLDMMAASASRGGMIPEQVWDGSPIPQRRLYPGRPTGSAMPLAWAHAEFIKLAVSRNHGRPVDRPEAVWKRYGGTKRTSTYAFWWPHAQIRSIVAGCRLVIGLPRAAMVHWGIDGWREVRDLEAIDTGLGFWVAELDIRQLREGERIDFTIRWQEDGWAGIDYRIEIAFGRRNVERISVCQAPTATRIDLVKL